MERFEPYPSLALALLAGLLIGLERENSRPTDAEGRSFLGGVRTFPLIALLGALAQLLSPATGPWVVAVFALCIGALLTVGYSRDAQAGHAGFTSEVSALITFGLGAFATAQSVAPLAKRAFIIGAISVAVTVLLSQKTQLRALSAKLSRDDVIATLKFLVVAVVLLPLLPDERFGPWGVLNPFRIGLVVALIAGVDFVGYVATRAAGERGLLVSGAIGGLVSSTAVTLASAGRAKATPTVAGLAAVAVLIACTIMFVRVGIIAALASMPLAQSAALPLGVMALVTASAVALFWFRERKHAPSDGHITLNNPFELTQAVRFAGFFIIILLVSRWASERFGERGLYIASVAAGLTDVDAITVSMTSLVEKGELTVSAATRAIVLASVSNSVTKGIMALVLGRGLFGRRVAGVLLVASVVGVVLAFTVA